MQVKLEPEEMEPKDEPEAVMVFRGRDGVQCVVSACPVHLQCIASAPKCNTPTSGAGAQADADQAEERSKAKSGTRGVLGFGLMGLVDWVNARVGC